MSIRRLKNSNESVPRKAKTDFKAFDEEVEKSYEDSSDSDAELQEVKPRKAAKTAAKKPVKKPAKGQAKASTSNSSESSKASSSKAATSAGKNRKKKKESDDEDSPKAKRQKKDAVPPSQNPKFANPPKVTKPNFKKFAPAPDPSSEVQTALHKHQVVYNGTTYYVPSIPHKNFQAQWDAICEMRAQGGCAANAAVDTMGCSKLHDEKADPATQRFQSLGKLKKFGLTIDSLCDANIDEVDECINNMMSHQQKAYNIIHIARRCRDEFGGDVPKTKAEMITLPGAGIKVANLAMYSCWGKIEGIGVDTHLNRILHRLRWCESTDRDKQMAELQSWMPKAMWWDLNAKLLGFGQKICESSKPKCDQCLISNTCAWYAENV